jgi:tRNA threonylcarbamoyladenosine biosynthesis protein TsaE
VRDCYARLRQLVQIGQMPVPVTVSLPDLAATEALAERLAALARTGDCILLEGPLGAGKTALARAFLRAAADDPAMEVPSPSFTLVQIYDTRIGPVFHYDLWRLDGPNALTELDWEDALDAIVLVEWPERLGPLRPPGALTIRLQLADGDAREATILGWEDRLPALLPGLTGRAGSGKEADKSCVPAVSPGTADAAESVSDHGHLPGSDTGRAPPADDTCMLNKPST